jgi:glycosyltransferase involved in cell wall biosynthesis
MKPLVSICCITYNHIHFLDECIKGFLIQKTNFPIEILIHDDASTDGTTELIKSNVAKYPEIIKPTYQKENQFSKGKRITPILIQKAQGKYIALCEGDDYWTDPLKLQKQVDFLEGNEGYVMCYHNAKIVDEKGQIIKDSKLPLKSQKDFESIELKKGAFVLTLSVCFRNLIKNFPPEMYKVVNGDTFLFSLLGQYGKGKYLKSVNDAVYRAHDAGIWSSLNEKKRKASSLVTAIYLSKYYKRNKDREAVLMINKKINSLIANILMSNDKKAINISITYLFKEIRLKPIFWFLLYKMSFKLFNKGYFFRSRFLKAVK